MNQEQYIALLKIILAMWNDVVLAIILGTVVCIPSFFMLLCGILIGQRSERQAVIRAVLEE